MKGKADKKENDQGKKRDKAVRYLTVGDQDNQQLLCWEINFYHKNLKTAGFTRAVQGQVPQDRGGKLQGHQEK